MGEAVQMIAEDRAPMIKQPEVGATYDAFLNKPEVCRVDMSQSAKKIHNFIRGLDSSPGAWGGIEASDEVVDLLGRLTHVHAAHLWFVEKGVVGGTDLRLLDHRGAVFGDHLDSLAH